MKPGIKQISEITGFSLATISNVLNNKGVTNIDTRNIILKAAQDIGYVSKKNSNRIKLVAFKNMEEIKEYSAFFSLLFSSITNECAAMGYKMEIQNLYRSSVDFESQLESVMKENITGIIFLATDLDDSVIDIIQDAFVPTIVLDNHPRTTEYSSVSINNVDAAYTAIKYLINNGHERIGYLKSEIMYNNTKQRKDGYLLALRDLGIEHNEKFDVSLPLNMDDAYQKMKEYLLETPDLPTAYFACSDIVAIGAVKALKECGYKIPEDISIIGFDDIPFCSMISPSLSTIHVYEEELGKAAVQELVKIIEGKNSITSHILVNTSLIIRDSVKTLK